MTTVPMQVASLDIWDKKYRLKDKNDLGIDKTIQDTYKRVAKALSDVEKLPTKREEWYEKFLYALNNGAVPAGRIMSNAGAQTYKTATSLINCIVSDTIPDSMEGILNKLTEAGLSLRAGSGIGYDFSTLRPQGAFVSGAGANTSGPLSFMDIFDKMCFTISSAGGRRGAQMATFDVRHPDVEEFIKAKKENGRLRQFNFSLLITNSFIKAVKEDLPWKLIFPVLKKELNTITDEIVFENWSYAEELKDELVIKNNKVACKVYKTIRARELWDLIMKSTYDYAEPGFILIDEVNYKNNNWWCENIRATNPCGEQPLPPSGSCLLGSINLTNFVKDPFTPNACFDWDSYKEIVRIFTRMLDNVVELNGLPLEAQRKEIIRKRRHGMGYFGLGSVFTMLRMKYGSEESIKLTEEITKTLAITGWEVALELAKEKGPAPIMEEVFVTDNGTYKGKDLHAMCTNLKALQFVEPELYEGLRDIGARFTHQTSIAPTGTISLSFGNNASNGIEPSFAHSYSRNIIRDGKKSKEKVDVYSYEFLAYKTLIDPNATVETLPDYFITTDNITPKEHIDIQAAAQKWIDSSISKTINVPSDFPFEDFKNVYLYAHEKGLKGCATFRFNPEAFQGVLVKDSDLAKTFYKFTLEDGSEITLAGNEEVLYDGEHHTVANLYDSIKEGYYGKY